MQMKRVPDLNTNSYEWMNTTIRRTNAKLHFVLILFEHMNILYSNWDLKFGLSLLLIEDAFKYSSV